MGIKLNMSIGPDEIPNWSIRFLHPLLQLFLILHYTKPTSLLFGNGKCSPFGKKTAPMKIETSARPISLIPILSVFHFPVHLGNCERQAEPRSVWWSVGMAVVH